MVSRSAECMRQARKDLQYAQSVRDGGDLEWACLAAHHTAETALRAVLNDYGIQVRGRSVTNLCHALSLQITLAPSILVAAKRLDAHLVQPMDLMNSSRNLTVEDVNTAIRDASQLIDFCERL